MANDDDRMFDVRTIERRIDEGEITQEEYDEYLNDLPDVSENAEVVEAEFEVGVLEEDEEDEEAEEADEEDEE